jgi:hypothetical protein
MASTTNPEWRPLEAWHAVHCVGCGAELHTTGLVALCLVCEDTLHPDACAATVAPTRGLIATRLYR